MNDIDNIIKYNVWTNARVNVYDKVWANVYDNVRVSIIDGILDIVWSNAKRNARHNTKLFAEKEL